MIYSERNPPIKKGASDTELLCFLCCQSSDFRRHHADVKIMWPFSSQWRHNGRDGVSNHRRIYCLLNRLFRHRSQKTSKFRVTGLCEGNSPVTGEFPAQRASNAEYVSIWWRHHVSVPVQCPRRWTGSHLHAWLTWLIRSTATGANDVYQLKPRLWLRKFLVSIQWKMSELCSSGGS